MEDRLTEKQKAWIYSERWEDTSVARCISNMENFIEVNEQLCILLGVTKAELIGKSWVDMTPEPIKTIDRENARMVVDGKIDHYKLPKIYQLAPNLPKSYVLMRVMSVPKVPELDESFDVFEVEFIPLSLKAYLQEVRHTLKSHLLTSDLPSEGWEKNLSLLRKLSLKDWITLSGSVLIVIILIRIAFFIPNEKLPALIEKFLP